MTGVESKIENGNLLTDIFGRWPSFHDAEVVRIALDRHDTPYLEAAIHVFEMTSQVENGAYVLKNHILATLRFIEIYELKLEDFNSQNVLSGLNNRDISKRQMERINFEVSFGGTFGVSADLQCNAIRVESAEPYVPNRR
jgi:hypothetical protein